jgi:hypothetical protein
MYVHKLLSLSLRSRNQLDNGCDPPLSEITQNKMKNVETAAKK